MDKIHISRIKTLNFEPGFAQALPKTYTLIRSANLIVHPAVSRVTLHGSRGLANCHRPNSDIDLSLIVDLPQTTDLERLLPEVLETTLSYWQADIELDLAVILDIRNCKLACFEQTIWDERFCQVGGVDCFGLYKIQKGFTGFVANAGIQVKLMYPCLKIWQRR
jgi:hypothetical protein